MLFGGGDDCDVGRRMKWGWNSRTTYKAFRVLPSLCRSGFFNPQAYAIIISWLAFQIMLERLLYLIPSVKVVWCGTSTTLVLGRFFCGNFFSGGSTVLSGRGGTTRHLRYPLSGHLCFWVSLGTALFLHFFGASVGLPEFDLGWAYDHFSDLACAAIAFSFAFSGYVYVRSFRAVDASARYSSIWENERAVLATAGSSGNGVYDFFLGRELNPRIVFPCEKKSARPLAPVKVKEQPPAPPLDLKYFCELRPGLIGWALLNVCFVIKHFQLQHSSVVGEGSVVPVGRHGLSAALQAYR